MNCPKCGEKVEHLSHVICDSVKVEDNYLVVATERVSNDYFHHCGQKFRGSSDGNGAIVSPIVESAEVVRG